MAQSGFTPIKLYRSSTAAAVPLAADLAPGELAINTNDGKLFYEDSSGLVQVIGWKTTPATAGGTGQTSYAVGDLLYASTTTALSKLADIATGNALISGGVGVAPSYGKIGLTTHVSGTLPATNGGTGQASYAVGDLLYAPTTTTVGKLADIATGNALISGGVGAAPSYGKIGLTTHVSGTLPVANGGTNATTASITSFNNITGYSASGATGTTSTNLVFSTSPEITTSLTTGSTSFDLLNTTATTINIGGAATAVNIGAATGTLTVANTTLAAKAITAATTLGVTGVSTLTGGAVIQGLTVGCGAGAVASNAAVGAGALAANSTGAKNTAVGLNALNAATIADENTAVGHAALQSASTGANNTAVGNNALSNLITGNQNVAIGNGALINLDGYGSNVAVGSSAMSIAQCNEAIGVGFSAVAQNTATGTVGIGSLALYSNTSGVGQTAVGYYALQLSTGGGNTAMGYQAGSAVTTGANNTIIGGYSGSAAPISATGSNYIVLSDGAGTVRQAIDPTGNSQFLTGAVVVYAPAPTAVNASATLTNADLQAQLLVASGVGFTLTMPTGSTLDTLVTWAGVDLGFDFSLINTGSGTITMAGNTGVTIVGTTTVLVSTSGRFRIRRTAASTYIVYRIG
jgi:hypothetical protein